MRNKDQYLKDKTEEVNFLREQLGLLNICHEDKKPFTEWLIKNKFLLRSSLYKNFIDKNYLLSETNFIDKKIFLSGDTEFETRYQRFDLKAIYKNPLREIYQMVSNVPNSVGLLTTSGMGAISSLLLGIKASINDKINIYAKEDIYFETIQLVKNYFPKISLNHTFKVDTSGFNIYWFDSIGESIFTEIGKKIYDKEIHMLVFDSTCYPLGDLQIDEVIKWATDNRILCSIVRSHIKLDSLAIEYGRMGSLLFVYNETFSGHLLQQLQKITSNAKDACSRFGLNFFPQSLFPFQNNSKFHELNYRRIVNIQTNTKRLHELLKNDLRNTEFKIFSYHHNLFFTIGFDREMTRDDINKQKKQLKNYLIVENIVVKEAGSFGFDFHAIDAYKDYLTQKDRIRFSPNDCPEEEIINLVKSMTKYFKEFKYDS